mmetsp:Transcript_31978/g.70261  ORF Transcript_31978/g.70261 Transcript_31978/m.70261 type:complete len:224 (-) Transcript_31978:279-950(-)
MLILCSFFLDMLVLLPLFLFLALFVITDGAEFCRLSRDEGFLTTGGRFGVALLPVLALPLLPVLPLSGTLLFRLILLPLGGLAGDEAAEVAKGGVVFSFEPLLAAFDDTSTLAAAAAAAGPAESDDAVLVALTALSLLISSAFLPDTTFPSFFNASFSSATVIDSKLQGAVSLSSASGSEILSPANFSSSERKSWLARTFFLPPPPPPRFVLRFFFGAGVSGL